MKRTKALVAVAIAFMEDPDGRHYGYATSRTANVRSGTLYPLLSKMLAEEWLVDGWEDSDEGPGRPRRRYYTLTDLGRLRLGAVIADAQREARFAPLLAGTRWASAPIQALKWLVARS
jgi:PadR family transcriptional regulator PadR